jgi:release factor glutamine methyltransferase
MLDKKPPTIHALLSWAVSSLSEQHIPTPRLEAEVLLAHVLGITRSQLLVRLRDGLLEKQKIAYEALITQRAQHMPLQYLTGHAEFMSLDFIVSPACLIPRDDTEILVNAVLKEKKNYAQPIIIDVCTGSGAIAIALQYYWKESKVFASDISEEALKIAKENDYIIKTNIDFRQGDLLQPFIQMEADIIVSNPPYIQDDVILSLMPEVLKEPHLALAGGADGLVFYRRLVQEAKGLLKSEGMLAVEIGSGQGADVYALFQQEGYREIQIFPDFAGLDRAIIGKK